MIAKLEFFRYLLGKITVVILFCRYFKTVLRIRIRIDMFLGRMDPDPDPALDPDPDPSIIKQIW